MLRKLRQFLVEFNLFQTNDANERELHTQRWSTRIYVVVFTSAIVFLLVQQSLHVNRETIEVKNPTLEMYVKLQSRHADINCPCSQISATYGSFLTLKPKYHPICSSSFLSQTWIEMLVNGMTSFYYAGDFRATASTQFQVLRELCQFSEMTITNNVRLLSQREFVSRSLSDRDRWAIEIEGVVKSFIDHMFTNAKLRITFLQAFLLYNVLGSGIQTPLTLSMAQAYDSVLIRPTTNLFPTSSSTVFCKCDKTSTCSTASGFYDVTMINNIGYIHDMQLRLTPSYTVQNWVTSCWAIGSVLQSSLYNSFLNNQSQLNEISQYFAWTTQTTLPRSLNLTRSNYSQYFNGTIERIFATLFTEDIQIERNYSAYFQQCQPSSCFFTEDSRVNFLSIMTSLLALFGGLLVVLRLSIPFIVTALIQRFSRRYRTVQNNNLVTVNYEQGNAPTITKRILNFVIEFNLFKSPRRQQLHQLLQQRWSTRIYILCFTLGIIILTLYTVFNVYKKTILVATPTLETVLSLQSDTTVNTSLRCPCTRINIPHGQIIRNEPIYHQVCSSEFVGASRWLYYIRAMLQIWGYWPLPRLDFRRSYRSFFLLASLCDLINQTVTVSLQDFDQTPLVTNNLLPVDLFHKQMDSVAETFRSELDNIFLSFFQLTRNITHLNQYLNDANIGPIDITSSLSPTFSINSYSGINGNTTSTCSCAFNINCKAQLGLFSPDYGNTPYRLVPGMYIGCFALESLVQSTLECFYDDTECLVNTTDFYDSSWIPRNFTRLSSNLSSRFMKNSTVGILISALLIEYWNRSLNYSAYFSLCQPLLCSYEILRQNTIIESLTIVLGLVGGLSLSLRLLVPTIIKAIYMVIRRRLVRSESERAEPASSRIKTCIKHLLRQLKQQNAFENENKTTANDIRDQQRATYVYYFLFFITLYILTLYNAAIYITDSFTVMNPSQEDYEQLAQSYGIAAVTCPCSQVSMPLSSFVQIQRQFHPVCSSEFISETFLKRLFEVYERTNAVQKDKDSFTLQRTIFSHYQALRSICNLATDAVKNAIEAYLSSSFIAASMMACDLFDNELSFSLTQFQSKMPDEFLSNLRLLRGMTQGNALVSLYSTNWYPVIYNWGSEATVYMHPQSYNNCSCLVSASCHEPSMPYIPGYMIGCTPLEGLLKSTMQCLYNQTCLDLLKVYLNFTSPFAQPLNLNATRFHSNVTVDSIVQAMFIEKFSSNVSYKQFFTQCHPSSCSIVRTRRNSVATIVTILLGLYGGLMNLFKIIIPILIPLFYKITRKDQRTSAVDVTSN